MLTELFVEFAPTAEFGPTVAGPETPRPCPPPGTDWIYGEFYFSVDVYIICEYYYYEGSVILLLCVGLCCCCFFFYVIYFIVLVY